jgi:hypothetical protein
MTPADTIHLNTRLIPTTFGTQSAWLGNGSLGGAEVSIAVWRCERGNTTFTAVGAVAAIDRIVRGIECKASSPDTSAWSPTFAGVAEGWLMRSSTGGRSRWESPDGTELVMLGTTSPQRASPCSDAITIQARAMLQNASSAPRVESTTSGCIASATRVNEGSGSLRFEHWTFEIRHCDSNHSLIGVHLLVSDSRLETAYRTPWSCP